MIGLANPPCDKPTGIAGRDFISWSQLSTFRQCPLRYRFRYLDKIDPEFVASSLLLGSAIHSAIEFHHRRQLEGGEPATMDELLNEFWEEWRCRAEESPEVRFSRNENFSSIQELASRMLTAFMESEIANPSGVVIVIEDSLRSTILPGRPEFLGIVDLIFVDGQTIVIRDYKTSRSKWKQGTAESSADQLLMYSDLVRSLIPDHAIKLEFAVITKTKSPTIELFQIAADRKRIDRTKQVAASTLDAIDAGIFYPIQSAMNCGGCPYRSACAAWRG